MKTIFLFFLCFSCLVYLYNNDSCVVIQIKYTSKLCMYIQNAYDHDFMKMYNEYNDGELFILWWLLKENVVDLEVSISWQVRTHQQPFYVM